MSAEHQNIETNMPMSRYWLTMFELGETALRTFSTLDNQADFEGTMQTMTTDPTSEARVFTDEEGQEIYVALNIYEVTPQLAITRGLAALWRGLEAAHFNGSFSVAEARFVAADRLGSTSVEDAWPAMDYVEKADLKATLATLSEERAVLGTFIESN